MPALPIDEELREYLREWRRGVAKTARIPAYIVMHDTTLDDLCRKLPSNLRELRQVFGIGERKAELYGREILAAIEAYSKGAQAKKN